MTNLNKMLKQAQEMQQKMEEMKASLEAMEVEGTAGGGMVTVTLNGKGVMKGVKIDPSLYKEEDKDMIEDLVLAAHNDAKDKVEEKSQEEMAKMTGGLNLPPGMKLPF